MKGILKLAASVCAAAALVACGGGGGGGGSLAAGADTAVAISPANGAQLISALENLALSYATGVPSFGTTTATTLTIKDTATSPTFSVTDASGAEAIGTLSFGSCKFKVVTSTFTGVGHPLAAGQEIVVTPCTLSAATSGQTVTGLPVDTDVKLVLGTTQSAARKLPITITPSGEVEIRTPSGTVVSLGTISVVAVTGAS